MASRGSVLPLFHQQIRNGGPVAITAENMTRFLMTLDHAVDTVFEAISGAAPGEIVIPVAPSAVVIDIARALIGDREIRTVVTGVRPGEKEHEILVSDEECRHTYRRGDGYYAIAPMLPELVRDQPGGPAPLLREYSSADAPAGLEETAQLLRRNRLMLDQVDLNEGELLR
jgi:UDP-glucose 4-epimerase